MYDFSELEPNRKEMAIAILIVLAVLVAVFSVGYMLGLRNAGTGVPDPSADKNFSALINPDIYEFIATHRDKILHFLAGVVITGVVFCATGIPAYGFAAALFTGTMKELRDWGCYLGFSWKDMVATWIGGFFGLAFLMAVQSV